MKRHGFRIVLMLLFAGSCLRADTITLHASASIPADSDEIRLMHLADLDGPEAEAWADLVIAGCSDRDEIRITIGEVRASLFQTLPEREDNLNLSKNQAVAMNILTSSLH